MGLEMGSMFHRATLRTAAFAAVLECAVYNPFLSSIMLAIEAQRVVKLRMVRLAWGGCEGWAEAQSMVVEKMNAAGEAVIMLMFGGSPERVIARYREHVAANIERLSAV